MNDNRKNLLKGYNLLLYFAGSMIMNEPAEECVTDFWINGTLKKLPVSSSNPRFVQAAALLRDSCDDRTLCKKMLIEDYSRLFAEGSSLLASANASLYRKPENDGMMSSEKISEFYNEYGWKSNWRDKIQDDHLSVELLFLTRMVDNYLALDDDPCRCEMQKEICRFIEQYILSWIPEWNEKIQKHADTLCYKGIGTLIYACVEDLYGIFSYCNRLL
jgi:TorA maturation chaperone TorD